MIVQHVRKGGKIVGTLVGISQHCSPYPNVTMPNNNLFNIGYSLCNKKDKFNKQHGTEIAYGRAIKNPVAIDKLPRSLRWAYQDFYMRCNRYFKAGVVEPF